MIGRARMMVAVLAACGVAGIGVGEALGAATPATTRTALGDAAAAVLKAAIEREAPALCADLTPAAGAKLVIGAASGSSCETAAAGAFAQTSPDEAPEGPVTVTAQVRGASVSGRYASAEVDFTILKTQAGEGIAVIAPARFGWVVISYEEIEGSWLPRGPVAIAEVDGCRLGPGETCPAGAKILSISFGVAPRGGPTTITLPVPPAVRRAGGALEAQFKLGRRLVAQSGCLACHRIGAAGNDGPGGSLTHIGARLSLGQIEHALVDPKAPMPSFGKLAAAKRHAIRRFLSLLR